MTNMLDSIYHEFGLKSRIAAPIVGSAVLYFLRKEDNRLATNYPYEPPTFYETSVQAVRPGEKAVLHSEATLSHATPEL